jgi:hypothetical protein
MAEWCLAVACVAPNLRWMWPVSPGLRHVSGQPMCQAVPARVSTRCADLARVVPSSATFPIEHLPGVLRAFRVSERGWMPAPPVGRAASSCWFYCVLTVLMPMTGVMR